MDLREKTVNSKKIYKGKIVNLRLDEVELPNGNFSRREIVEHNGAVAIVPYYKNKVIMVEQFRKATEEILLEIPAGKVEKGEDLVESAKRELEEEIGYQPANLKWLCKAYTSPGFTNETIDIYLATKLVKTEQNTDEDEFINIREFDISTVGEMMAKGEFRDAKTIIGLQYLLADLKEG
ncbi:NUDIX hydrolase [Orenia marismortui]|uniref:NUDIX hydrolase n=1 Tax=Orenia marismortui TaxID=46469 RepID=UPI00037D743F|nr:NUDIX hydrolase [Orenia marismortui]